MLLTHVDDFLYAGTTSFIQKVIDPLCKQFEISHQSTKAFKYIGLNIEQNSHGIYLDQINYIEEIKPIEISRERQKFKQSQCNSFEHDQYRKLTGQLNLVANQSRPDIVFDVCNLSSNVKFPTIEDVIKLNKVVIKLKLSPLKLKFPVLHNLKNCSIKCFSDTSLGNLPTGKSTEGLITFICDEFVNCSHLNWKSRSIKRVVRSSLSAETCAIVDALDGAYFIMFSFKEILYRPIK